MSKNRFCRFFRPKKLVKLFWGRKLAWVNRCSRPRASFCGNFDHLSGKSIKNYGFKAVREILCAACSPGLREKLSYRYIYFLCWYTHILTYYKFIKNIILVWCFWGSWISGWRRIFRRFLKIIEIKTSTCKKVFSLSAQVLYLYIYFINLFTKKYP